MRCIFYIVYFLMFFIPGQIYGQQIKHLGAYDEVKSGAVRAFAKDTWAICGLVQTKESTDILE